MVIEKICCIGAGYVGTPTSCVIALKCPHIKVTVVDCDRGKIQLWNSKQLPIYEPGLEDIVNSNRNVNLFFSENMHEAIIEADLIFISVNTPTKEDGFGKGSAADLSNVENTARMIANLVTDSKIIVEKSTVPVKAADSICTILAMNKKESACFQVLSNPEFLAEGSAIENLLNPDRVLIGHEDSPEGKKAFAELCTVYENWVPRDRILETNTWSSELSKLAANAFLAQRISSINSLTAVCEATGADISEVALAIGKDHRIGPHFLEPSLGFGGSCFRKDIQNFIYICEHLNLPKVAEYWAQVLNMNDYQKTRFAKGIVTTMFNTVRGKSMTMLGFAFKKNTGDTRDTPAKTVAAALLDEGASIRIYDPKVPKCQIEKDLTLLCGAETVAGFVKVFPTAEEAVVNSHSIIVCTEWDEFRTLDYKALYGNMMKPAYIFDGRKILNHEALKEIGFKVYSIGKSINNNGFNNVNNGSNGIGDCTA